MYNVPYKVEIGAESNDRGFYRNSLINERQGPNRVIQSSRVRCHGLYGHGPWTVADTWQDCRFSNICMKGHNTTLPIPTGGMYAGRRSPEYSDMMI